MLIISLFCVFQQTLIKKIYLLLLILGFGEVTFSQELAAYHDYRDYFYVFDEGHHQMIEHHPVKSFKIARTGIAYVADNQSLKWYSQGDTREISSLVEDYEVTENLLVYSFGQNLFVFDGEKKYPLSMNCTNYKADSGIVAY